jgi:hypothetical protein
MWRRPNAIATAMVAATVCLPVWVPVASAHEPAEFDACVKPYRPPVFWPCDNKFEVRGAGVRFVVRAEILPHHVGRLARVWLSRPRSESWTKVRTLPVRPGGRLHWYWTPDENDIYNYTPWRFRFTVPRHGRSDIVRVLVRSADF